MNTSNFQYKKIGVALLASLFVTGSASAATPVFGAPQPAYPISFQGITPKPYPDANFVSNITGTTGDPDNQVCYAMVAQGLIGSITGELRGFKIDPPISTVNGYVSVALRFDRKHLAFALDPGAAMLAVIVKGGPGYHVYDYTSNPLTSDSWLVSTTTKKGIIPEISHYNICYKITPPTGGDQGCTPGYWRNHVDRWAGILATGVPITYTLDFDQTFQLASLNLDYFDPNVTLGMAVSNPQIYGTFAFHAVAALLNSYGGVPNSSDGATVDYPYTPEQVIQMVQSAVANGTTQTTKDDFAAANELGCPLSGTKANSVPQ